MNKKKQVILRTTERKSHLLKIQAAKHNMSVNQYLNWLIEQHMDDNVMLTQQPTSYTTANA